MATDALIDRSISEFSPTHDADDWYMGRMSVNTLLMRMKKKMNIIRIMAMVVVTTTVVHFTSACEFNCQTSSWCGSTEPVHVPKHSIMIMAVNTRDGERELAFDDDACVVSASIVTSFILLSTLSQLAFRHVQLVKHTTTTLNYTTAIILTTRRPSRPTFLQRCMQVLWRRVCRRRPRQPRQCTGPSESWNHEHRRWRAWLLYHGYCHTAAWCGR